MSSPQTMPIAVSDAHISIDSGSRDSRDTLRLMSGGSQYASGINRVGGDPDSAMTQADVLRSIANRILYSRYYTWLYLGMAIASVVCLVLVKSIWVAHLTRISFTTHNRPLSNSGKQNALVIEAGYSKTFSPSGMFLWLDAFVNAAMIVEVMIRANAMGKTFWKSIWNIIDTSLVFLCILTLFWLLFGDCSAPDGDGGGGNEGGKWEPELDALLLIARNAMQLFRLVAMMNRKIRRRPRAIDFDGAMPAVDYLGTREEEQGFSGRGFGPDTSMFDFEGEDDGGESGWNF
ncbi:hypothetical protein HDU82_005030 [Entophlyctis luteolus]|nr:hypothetical protein HDU82_005030 [Entophlyctis luteolus]